MRHYPPDHIDIDYSDPRERGLDCYCASCEFVGPVGYTLERAQLPLLHERTCSTCKHHGRQSWDAAGFGSCGEIQRRGLVQIIGYGIGGSARDSYIATHESLTCSAWTDPKAETAKKERAVAERAKQWTGTR